MTNVAKRNVVLGSAAAGILAVAWLIAFGATPHGANADAPKSPVISTVPKDYCVNLANKYHLPVQKLGDGTTIPVFQFDIVDHPELKLWSDATNSPAPAQTNEAMRASHCVSPTETAMSMNGLGPQTVDGVNIAQKNKWIAAQGNPSTAISGWAEGCRTAQTEKDAKMMESCADTMSHMAYLLAFFQQTGLHQESSLEWYYSAPGVVVGKIPAFRLNQGSYAGMFVEFTFTEKAQDTCITFGYNVGLTKNDKVKGGDQRLVRIKCVPPRPVPSPPSGCGKGKKNNCSTPPVNPPTTKPPTTRPPTHPPTTKPPTTPCGCGARASQAPKPEPTSTRNAPTQAPPPRKTSAPVVTGAPTPADTGTHTAPKPTPTGGPFG